MKKNGFLTFCFALIPGAGQMYQGYMKRGLCLMTLFCLDIAVMAFTRIEAFAFALPIIWFFAFFDTFNIRNQIIAGNAPVDRIMFNIEGMFSEDWKRVFSTRHRIFGGALILVGAGVLYDMFIQDWARTIPDSLYWLREIIYDVPTLVIAVVIIALGIYLIRGKKPEQPRLTDDLKPFEVEKTEK